LQVDHTADSRGLPATYRHHIWAHGCINADA
jgi:hypothetical protein